MDISSSSTPVFLIGYMASGKTTFGRALARALGKEFIDLDFYIEQRFRSTISQIFAREGEEAFRRKEAAMLREVGEFDNVVIACGGGTPCYHDNMAYMNSRGLTVMLEASVERTVERLMINNAKRPLMAGKSRGEIEAEVTRGLESRMPFYSQSRMRFDSEYLEDRRQIDDSVARFIETMRCEPCD